MSTTYEEFPERRRVWEGAILGSIVHALMMTKFPDLSHEQSWDGNNYNVQDSMGSKGTVAFSGDKLVGVFFDDDSPRNPFTGNESYDLESFFKGMPSDLRPLAFDEALQYMLQDYRGKVMPIITAAFWSEGERLAAAEPWQQVFDNGAHLIRIQLMEIDEALIEWQINYEMSGAQLGVARSLFNRKIAAPDTLIEVLDWERDILIAEAKDEEAIAECRQSLAELNIILP